MGKEDPVAFFWCPVYHYY